MNASDPAVALVRARCAIARALLGAEEIVDASLGTVTLHDHQQSAAARVAARIATHGGVMLAEAVGVGKTYVALAVARHHSPALIIVPASLREMWQSALRTTGTEATLVTHEALSRDAPAAAAQPPALVVIDEAHRFRSPRTRRYAAVAELCNRARVLLLTATPIQNRRADLSAQLALFLGRAAWLLSSDELATHVVRTTQVDRLEGMPSVSGPHRLTLGTDDDCLDDLVALPPPVPALDEGTAAALVTYTLVHQWSSSRAALVASLKRRLARALAMQEALAAGRAPTRAELGAWCYADDAVQLAFPGLVSPTAPPLLIDLNAISASLARYVAAATALVARLRARPDPDAERAALLRDLRARHPGERIIAFAQYTETVAALFRTLSREAGMAALTARGGRVAGGPIARSEIISQFAPRQSRAAISRVERIDLLLTTDLLSEGLNLQEASVVVHLDLPWNPARLDQRVGRIRRLGHSRETVTVYTLSPPAAADRLLRLEGRLREKLCTAQETVGIAGRILPTLLEAMPERRAPLAEDIGAMHAALRRWLPNCGRTSDDLVVAAVGSAREGFVAAAIVDGAGVVIADFGRDIETSAPIVRAAIEACDGDGVAVDPGALRRALRRLDRWLAEQRGAAAIDLRAAAAARTRRVALARVARAVARTPRHRRAIVAPLADAARAAATAVLGEGAERVLDSLIRADLPDEAWLRSVAAFAELNARPVPAPDRHGDRVVAVILFQRKERADALAARGEAP